ncbi:bifunctional UDP-N-acetylglucosamine diphosphorylase/glucosamine-1-phosphate N-acetyltransferase GlmU [Neptuniibacter sp.]|uniref:bifunctional UDP-N-acetylglucosamine diphosphorylase/glucosamine-1-phosphate N-acetyltransferase GlmU n=1 Tax=Neptuniibacter sp. TaxID=1962643 RepID=UPI002616D085|nr:bifunctional UDP-N-acetylglucosamine diphosphorylase/glucosamine-1-phosphate N-acetyltransferase GlmU [Neptuniibacter sp.]MCP4595932.1 UDP-N-acetylglucosamine diphosphorylase/glucosamine-1-phosphate N-acetyltransferase [Neptuniibacter sp.]
MSVDVVILAAGQGSRMKSKLPKVLHQVGGKAMVQHVIDTAAQLGDVNTHVVIGHGADLLRESLQGQRVNFALQSEQKGTGHAVAQAMPEVSEDSVVLVLYGDVPLTKAETMSQMVEIAATGDLALLTVDLKDPTGYGRIVRNSADKVVAIVEHKDASPEQHKISEVNTGILAVKSQYLRNWLPQLSSENAQGEYYLTDIIAMAAEQGLTISAIQPDAEEEVQGVNNRVQLAELERWYQLQQAEYLMINGATLADPNRIDVRGNVKIGQDLLIDINVVLEGDVTLGDNVVIEPNCYLKNCTVGAGTRIKANTVIEDAAIAENCDIGPFARIRPGTQLSNKAKVGNFVETKKAIVGEGSKINHLSYIGDAILGKDVNIGAGTITCNYDGVNKSTTAIGDNAFIGSNTALVAPVQVGSMATVGAGSTISKSVSDDALAVTRSKQTEIKNWPRPQKKGS